MVLIMSDESSESVLKNRFYHKIIECCEFDISDEGTAKLIMIRFVLN